jgi:excisionase family DNA binding protein
MTGRDLILYILSNGLEDEPIFKDGKFIGFLTPSEVAEQMDVGIPTVLAWVIQGQIEGVHVNRSLYIPANYTMERKNE